MNPAEATVREFWRRMASNDFDSAAPLLAETFVLEWPQSNERIRGALNFARMNREYPAHGPWRFELRRLVAGADEVVTQVAVTDGTQSAEAISMFQVQAGRIVRLVEFWPANYPAPANRAHLVEPLQRPGDAQGGVVPGPGASMLHHLSLGARDLDRAVRFYDAILAPLGYGRVWSDLRPGEAGQAVGYGPEGSGDRLAIKQVATAVPQIPGFHLAFAAPSRVAVRAFHAAALAAGGTDHGPPGERPAYGPDYYAAFVVDPEGHRLEAVCKAPEGPQRGSGEA